MSKQFINAEELYIDGDYLQRIQLKLESYKDSIKNDPSFVWLGSQDETMKDADNILKDIETWELSKKLIDSRLKDNSHFIESLKELLLEIPELLEKSEDFDTEEDPADDIDDDIDDEALTITLDDLKKLTRIGKITYLQGTVERPSIGKVDSLFLNRNEKIRPPLDKLDSGDTFHIDEISLDIGGTELEIDAVSKIIANFN